MDLYLDYKLSHSSNTIYCILLKSHMTYNVYIMTPHAHL